LSYRLYILRCADGSLYTGIALDVARRLEDHRGGKRGAKYLRGRTPVELVFECDAGARGDALRLEHRIKQMSRADKEALIAGAMSLGPVGATGLVQASGDSSG
jgi:putative endonuclease